MQTIKEQKPRITLPTAFRLCDEMWQWIKKEVQRAEDDNDPWDVQKLKNQWRQEHEHKYTSCFFCYYCGQYPRIDGDSCEKCPGRIIDPKFDCMDVDCDYHVDPIEFADKVHTLYIKYQRKRRESRKRAVRGDERTTNKRGNGPTNRPDRNLQKE